MVVFRHFVFHYYWNRRLPLFFHKDRQTFPSPSLSVSLSLSPSLSPCQPPSPSPVPVLFWGCDGRSCRLSVIQQSPSGRPRVHPSMPPPPRPPPTGYWRGNAPLVMQVWRQRDGDIVRRWWHEGYRFNPRPGPFCLWMWHIFLLYLCGFRFTTCVFPALSASSKRLSTYISTCTVTSIMLSSLAI